MVLLKGRFIMKFQYYINSCIFRDLCTENNYCDRMNNEDYTKVSNNVPFSDFHGMKIHIRWMAEQILTKSSKFHNVSLKDVVEVRARIFEQIFNNCLCVKVSI